MRNDECTGSVQPKVFDRLGQLLEIGDRVIQLDLPEHAKSPVATVIGFSGKDLVDHRHEGETRIWPNPGYTFIKVPVEGPIAIGINKNLLREILEEIYRDYPSAAPSTVRWIKKLIKAICPGEELQEPELETMSVERNVRESVEAESGEHYNISPFKHPTYREFRRLIWSREQIQAILESLLHWEGNLQALKTAHHLECAIAKGNGNFWTVGGIIIGYYGDSECALCQLGEGNKRCEKCPLGVVGKKCSENGSPWVEVREANTNNEIIEAARKMRDALMELLY